MKIRYRKIPPLLLALLCLLSACGGGSPDASTPSQPVSAPPSAEAIRTALPSPSPAVSPTSAPAQTPAPSVALSPSPTPVPTPAPDPVAEKAPTTCTFSISCAVLLDRLDECKEEKRELVPESGWLLAPTEVALEEGDSVFDLLLRVCRAKGIHMEFSMTPGLGTAYIEGIGNLYEFDCGDLSGWVFAVNGVSPNRGCSDIFPAPGDRVEWCYTCALGDDLPHITRGQPAA